MAVTVYVWKREAEFIGHASVQVGSRYYSLWPADGAGKKDVVRKASHPPSFSANYQEDVVNEGMREAEKLTLWNLDEDAMTEAAAEMLSAGCRYNLLKMNCSSFAAALLEAGSGRPPSFVPSANPAHYVGQTKGASTVARSIIFARGGMSVWTPEQLFLYARELEHGTTRR